MLPIKNHQKNINQSSILIHHPPSPQLNTKKGPAFSHFFTTHQIHLPAKRKKKFSK
ncbi:unnamed protein product [Periconia digitata]|uniref:Uncharacterized protein n=1 Tax=Periconia digitata TaxID=1303443 RepID=A0A9W4U1Z9_9PLEO|nr:unnamed protein product [Periconia digitata]